MDEILKFLPVSAENPTLLMSVLVFAAAATLAFGVMGTVLVRSDVRRRAAGIAIDANKAGGSRSLRHASTQAAQRLVEYTNRHFSPASGDARMLKRRLVQAGFLDPRAGAFYFLARLFLAVGLAAASFIAVPLLLSDDTKMFWPLVWFFGMAGYLAPKIYLDRRIKRRRNEHRAGFPDFMDLLVVCADAGLSMEAALDRV